ncbi:YkvA family protein [Laceyella putida]|uniref:YkvA family protein n=1 Tax=Laceyella putida TaxID=110101 RepID=A0ABW2RK02_9BACL
MANHPDRRRIWRKLMELKRRALTKEGTQTIIGEFNHKVERVGGIDTIIHKLKVMYQYFRDPEVKVYKKGLIGAALLYFIVPADVMVDVLPVVGYVDDMTAVLIVWRLLSSELEAYMRSH